MNKKRQTAPPCYLSEYIQYLIQCKTQEQSYEKKCNSGGLMKIRLRKTLLVMKFLCFFSCCLFRYQQQVIHRMQGLL